MKNVCIVPLIAFGFLVGAQTISAQSTPSKYIETVESQEKYTEVTLEKLPQPVLDAVNKDYKKATINKAAVKEDNSVFKLQLTKIDGKTIELYCDTKGNWITKE